MTSPPQLVPLGPAQVVDHAIRLMRRHFGALATLLAVIWAPLALLQPLYAFTSADEVVVTDGQLTYLYDSQSGLDLANSVSFVLLLLSLVAAGVALLAMVRIVTASYVGKPVPTWKEAAAFGFRRFLSLVWIFVLVAAMAMAGLFVAVFASFVTAGLAGLVFVFFAIWLGVSWSVVLPALVVEDERGVAALQRSFRLVRKRWWPTLGALLVAFIILFAVQAGVAALLIGALELNSEVVVLALVTLVQILLNFVVYPFGAALATVIYYDLRVRKEGLDLQLLTQNLRLDDLDSGPTRPAAGLGDLPPLPGTDEPPPRPTAPGIGLSTPPPEGFVACPDCGRHRAADVVACPFCGSAVR